MTNENRELKNQAIRDSIKATREKRKQQVCRVYKVKIDESRLSSKQKEQLKMMFIEAKWLWNDILNWCEQSEENTPWNYKITKQANVKYFDGHTELKDLKFIHSQAKQMVQKRMCDNIKTLSTLKKRGFQKPGKIKFKSEINIIDIKQLQSKWIKSHNKVIIPGISGKVVVNGLKQFFNIPNIDYACAKLLNTPKGYYLSVTTYVYKNEIKNKQKIQKTIGIDFGCSTDFTTSEGEKIEAKIQESERLKRLQRNLSRKKKGSENFRKNVLLIKKEYQKQNNKKTDLANKIVSKFCEYETVVIQDEQLSNWKKNGHGKAVQHSILGKVKSKLMTKDNVVVLSKTAPTTKLCTNCGEFHDEMKVWNREFVCDCGIKMDRDIHAAQNMVWMFHHNVGVGHTKLKRVETEALVQQIFNESVAPTSVTEARR